MDYQIELDRLADDGNPNHVDDYDIVDAVNTEDNSNVIIGLDGIAYIDRPSCPL